MNNQKSEQDQLKHTLRNMRKKANKTIEQIAEDLGVSRQTISNWESGKSTPDAVSFMNFVEAYDPSLENVKSLLKNKGERTENDELSKWGERYCDFYRKTGSTFLDKVGPTSFYIDEFLDFVMEEVKKYSEKDDLTDLSSDMPPALYILIKYAIPPHKSTSDIDFHLSMIELGIKLRHEGYIVNTIDDEGLIGAVILDDEQRRQLDSIILEHMLIPSKTLDGMSATEKFALRDIQSEYDKMKQKIKDLEGNKLEPILAENDFIFRKEFVLSIGCRKEDSSISCVSNATIYTSNTLDEMAKYLFSVDEKIKNLVDNKNTFFVLSDNADDEYCFDPKGDPIEIGDIKLYRVNCHNEDEQDPGDGNE